MKEEMSKEILGQMKTWGGNYDSMEGCSHNGVADKIDQKIDSKKVTLNTELDPNESKPNSMNPGFDKGFWARGNPQMDTTGHGKLGIPKC